MAEGILTAEGQLARASEFRFNYWRTESEHRFITVVRGRKRFDGWWAITEGGEFGAIWDGTEWCDFLRGGDAYRFELETALPIAERLAFEENQRVVSVMENRFPGEFRGGPYDFARKE